jgi:ubiquinone/menaquinone biosynthesis C-methylase UbiE
VRGGGGAVEVSAANAQELPFGDGSFDRYMANLSLMLVPEPEVAARAMRARGHSGRRPPSP